MKTDNYYNSFSEVYNEMYLNNIRAFKKNMLFQNYNETSYIHFYPSFGIKKNDNVDFLIYGQATNGWSSFFDIEKEILSTNLIDGIKCSNRYCQSQNFNPIDLVNVKWTKRIFNDISTKEKEIADYFDKNDYVFYRSFFWNVVYKLISDYYSFDRESWEWSSKIIWSNLYKIARDGENPNQLEREYQLQLSAELIKQEILEAKPKYCIMLTNINWWLPFQKLLYTKNINLECHDIIQSVEQYNDTKIIVTDRPFIGSSELYTKEILKVIKQL